METVGICSHRSCSMGSFSNLAIIRRHNSGNVAFDTHTNFKFTADLFSTNFSSRGGRMRWEQWGYLHTGVFNGKLAYQTNWLAYIIMIIQETWHLTHTYKFQIYRLFIQHKFFVQGRWNGMGTVGIFPTRVVQWGVLEVQHGLGS